jgi:hypothetical protein
MKKILSELYSKNVDVLIQKENRLLELKNQIKEFNASHIISKVKIYLLLLQNLKLI